jgi:hypothetical protein
LSSIAVESGERERGAGLIPVNGGCYTHLIDPQLFADNGQQEVQWSRKEATLGSQYKKGNADPQLIRKPQVVYMKIQ